MIKEAIEKILSLKKDDIVSVDGRNYWPSTQPIKPPIPPSIDVSTLTGLRDFVLKKCSKELYGFILVTAFDRVSFLGELVEPFLDRPLLCEAKSQIESFKFDEYHGMEEFIIGLEANFEKTENLVSVLQIASAVTDVKSTDYTDDGFSTDIVLKEGVIRRGNATIKNPILLKPRRTFHEIDQVESAFIFRLQKGSDGIEFALFEADNGAWQDVAMQRIKEWLEKEIAGARVLA